jgi:hypothetical protein
MQGSNAGAMRSVDKATDSEVTRSAAERIKSPALFHTSSSKWSRKVQDL